MEVISDGEKKKTPECEIKSKRKMKTASQLEILEKTYAVEAYPSEALRADLSVKLGLSDRQLQMWFCHRRLKDRKTLPIKQQRGSSPALPLAIAGEKDLAGKDSVQFVHSGVGMGIMPVQRLGGEAAGMKRYFEVPPPQQNVVELRAVAFVEAQLGEPLRVDGPVLGMEFDPLPPGAFGAPIDNNTTVGQQKHPGLSFETKHYEQHDVKPVKDMFTIHPQAASRTLHEYQFLPEQPTVRSETHERAIPSHNYSSPVDNSNARSPSLTTFRSFMHGNEPVSAEYGFCGPLPNLNLLTRQVEDKVFPSSERRVANDEDVLRLEKKRKSEEARIAREIEAHEKRIRKELEKQDIIRRKREEQIRKEMERQERERRKEEERLLREKQREEERFLREQRRELERREKNLLKQSIRAEKMRQKEELRREKEAARLKAASERAAARKIAKESVELIEDERLELMELAASKKSLPTISSLDYETLQNLDLFRDMLHPFPPESVQLKRPFVIQPWNGSEESIGNLLMVWRFLITFADVLGLWPFTVDEFVQAFHDYDPRLLGEIHIALLKSILKDIEEATQISFSGLGANQNNAANPGGGHPQIVEGAYAWGFDIRSWQCNLNALTWPEILRQLALSAGFGPPLKKRSIEQAYHDDNEGNDGDDIISSLRNGAAAENAVAKMRERGFSNSRRSRHLLTPGTVKFAAFHILSLEGSKGLTILDVAHKIQKSGLRDLTTSKTPEASIAAALSRDTKLFERIAPSTYCVRPAYRKDPSDAEGILSAAKERIRIFKSGIVDGVADEPERDEDSESDVAEDTEVDDLGTDLYPKEEIPNSTEAKEISGKVVLGSKRESNEVAGTPIDDPGSFPQDLSAKNSDGLNKVKRTVALLNQSIDAAGMCNNATEHGEPGTDIDESNPGQPWVQGLMEGEYSDLSVEERLSAIVALIDVAIEGNSIRAALEDRLEAANALKKQILAETQLDKRRVKEEYVNKMNYSSYVGYRAEPNLTISSAEGGQTSLIVDGKINVKPVDPVIQHEKVVNLANDQNHIDCVLSEGNMQARDYFAVPENLSYQQTGYVAEKSCSQLKSYVGRKAEELYEYRSLPLGQDRRHNRYWRFITSESGSDPGCGRIFVEMCDGCWRLIDSEECFDALLASLDVRGIRESHLHSMMQKVEISFKETVRRNKNCTNAERENLKNFKTEGTKLDLIPDDIVGTDSSVGAVCDSHSDMLETSTSFSIELGRNKAERNNALKRYHDFENWMWKECINSSMLRALKYGKKRCKQLLSFCDSCHEIYFEENHCSTCHRNSGSKIHSLTFCEHVVQCNGRRMIDPDCTLNVSFSSPLKIRLIKVLLALVEVSIPPEALQPAWADGCRKSWAMKLHSALSAVDLIQILTQLESAIRRDYLSSSFETSNELLESCNLSSNSEMVSVLPWIPETTAAIALRLKELDKALSYSPNQHGDLVKGMRDGVVIKLPSKYAAVKNSRNHDISESVNLSQESLGVDMGNGPAGSSCGQENNGRDSGHSAIVRSQKKVRGSRSDGSKRKCMKSRLEPMLAWKGRPRVGVLKRSHSNSNSNSIAKVSNFVKTRDLKRDKLDGDGIRFQVEEPENGVKFSIYEQVAADQYHLFMDDFRVEGLRRKARTMTTKNMSDESDEEGEQNGDRDDDAGSTSMDFSE